MFGSLLNLWRQDDGQDLIEYSLLLAFVVIVTAGIFGFGNDSIQGIVGTSTNQLRTGNDVAHGR